MTENEVNAEIALGASTIEEIGKRCRAGKGCGMCHDRLRALLPLPTLVAPRLDGTTLDDLADVSCARVALETGD